MNIRLSRLLAVLFLFCCVPAQGTGLPRSGASAYVEAALDSLIAATQAVDPQAGHITLHSVMLLKHGSVIGERWLNGASPSTPHVMHSVSKTFTSAAVGLAIDEGLLELSDKVVGFFPDKLPSDISDKLKSLTVRDLLTMTSGHATECDARTTPGADWVENFLAHPLVHEPGTYYRYSSMSSYMLSAIIQKVSGEKTADYLYSRLFRPLRIDRPVWEESPQGITCGGWGLYIRTEDMAKMGQLLLQNGEWDGVQVLPAGWVKEMSSSQVASAPSGIPIERLAEYGVTKENNDWVQGYGYQLWRCRHNAFRADGKDGQYIIVLPELDAVITITADSSLYQPFLDMVWDLLLPVLR